MEEATHKSKSCLDEFAMITSAPITPAFLLSVAPRRSWLNTHQAVDFKRTIFFARRWAGLKKPKPRALSEMMMPYYDGIRARELSSGTNSLRARKRNQSNFPWNEIVGQPHRLPCEKFCRRGIRPTITLQMNDDFVRRALPACVLEAGKYDSAWSSLTRQFIPHLIRAGQVSPVMSLLDVAR